jgi:hypothetical protein
MLMDRQSNGRLCDSEGIKPGNPRVGNQKFSLLESKSEKIGVAP